MKATLSIMFTCLLLMGNATASWDTVDYYCKKPYVKIFTEKDEKFRSKIMGAMLIGAGVSLPLSTPVFYAIWGSAWPLAWLDTKQGSKKIRQITKSRVLIEEAFQTREKILDAMEAIYEGKLFSQTENRKGYGTNLAQEPEDLIDTYWVRNHQEFDRAGAKTSIDKLVDDINLDRENKVSYENIAETLRRLSDGDTFCPKDVPLTVKQIRKLVLKNL